jgi:hypothetical protein
LRVSLRVDNGAAAVWPSILYFGDDFGELKLERGERVTARVSPPVLRDGLSKCSAASGTQPAHLRAL